MSGKNKAPGGMAVFDKTLQKTHLWLRDLNERMGWEDEHRAYQGLRAVLHGLRDQLSADETAQLGAQFPLLVRGIYYEGWNPAAQTRHTRRLEDFVNRVESEFRQEDEIEALALINAVFSVLEKHVSAGEIADVILNLPKEIRALWPGQSSLSLGL